VEIQDMGMTITEKILAAHANKEKVKPGDIIEAGVDLVMSNDITAPLAIKELRRFGIPSVFNPQKICMVLDHCTPARDINSAEACKLVREFAGQHNLQLIFDVGRMGIEHALLPDEGLTAPGELIVGGDSHTCTYGALGAFSTGMGSTDIAAAMALGKVWLRVPETIKCVFDGNLQEYVTGKDLILCLIGQYGVDGAQYKSLEILGNTISKLGMDDRFTICNMAIEAGAKNGIIPPDETTIDYMTGRTERPFNCYNSDVDAAYHQVWNFKVDELTPLVAKPFSPANASAVAELEHTKVDQVVIGCCTNGRLEDLRRAAKILNGKKISKKVRTIVIPATQAIYKQSMKEGLLDIFIDSGAAVSTPTCGPCAGLHVGVLAGGEVCLSTTNRNFRGRMGSAGSKVYLANPYVAAATAIAGYICEPKEVV
jgi:3-isopropylmalate/(R)-2-methylmalate dehydratase large subunit